MADPKPLPPIPTEVRKALSELAQLVETFSTADPGGWIDDTYEALMNVSDACREHELFEADGPWRRAA